MLEDLPQSVRNIVEAALVVERLKHASHTDAAQASEADDKLAGAIESFTNKSRSFTGVATGDGECFCWSVDPDTYERLTGMSPESVWWATTDTMYVYPSTVCNPQLLKDARRKFTILVEEA